MVMPKILELLVNNSLEGLKDARELAGHTYKMARKRMKPMAARLRGLKDIPCEHQ